MKEREKVLLAKMQSYATQAIQFIGDMDFMAFSGDAKTISACVFNLSQIGEITGRLDQEFVGNTGFIPWQKMKGMRNRIVHDYEGIRLNIVWDVLVDFLPELVARIDELL